MAARTTISIPEDLKEAMDQVSDEANWSAVAAEAFREEILRIRTRQALLKGKKMDAAIERLRVSKQRYIHAAKGRGKECGIRWAQEAAEYEELKRFDDEPPLEPYEGSERSPGELFLFMILPSDADQSWRAVAEFWSRHGSGDNLDRDSVEFWKGFFEGVQQVYDTAVKVLD